MSTRWILVVDDDIIQAAAVSEFLEAHGFSVTTANDAQQAVLQAESLRPALVIMDMQMPVFGTGADAVRAMRSLPQLSRTPVIILTGMNPKEARAMLAPDPLLRLMSKPPDWPQLLAAVNGFLNTAPPPPPPVQRSPAAGPITQPGRRPCTALLILDDAAVLGDVRGGFYMGDTLYSATNGADALAYMRRMKLELVVTELLLPRFSGLELLRAVQTDPVLKDLPFIVLTGSRLADRETALLRREFQNLKAVFAKPVNPAELKRAVGEILSRPA